MDHEVHGKFLAAPENRRLYQQEKLLVDATELLAGIMEKQKMSRAELARAIGKSKAFVTQVLRGNHNMTLRTLADLFGAMDHEVVLQALPYVEVRTRKGRQAPVSAGPVVRIGSGAHAQPHRVST